MTVDLLLGRLPVLYAIFRGLSHPAPFFVFSVTFSLLPLSVDELLNTCSDDISWIQ